MICGGRRCSERAEREGAAQRSKRAADLEMPLTARTGVVGDRLSLAQTSGPDPEESIEASAMRMHYPDTAISQKALGRV